MIAALENIQNDIDDKIKACPDFSTCRLLNALFDREINDAQLADGVRTICRKCMEKRTVTKN